MTKDKVKDNTEEVNPLQREYYQGGDASKRWSPGNKARYGLDHMLEQAGERRTIQLPLKQKSFRVWVE